MLRIRDKRIRVILAIVLVAVIGVAAYQIAINLWAVRQYDQAVAAMDRYDFVQATTHIHRYLKTHPTNPTVRLLAAQAARRRSDFGEADRQLRLAAKYGASSDAVDLEAQLIAIQRGDLRSVDALMRYCEQHPEKEEFPAILEAIIEGSFVVQDLPLAHSCVALFLKHRPKDVDQAQGFVWRGKTNMFTSGLHQAIADFRSALDLVPDHYQARIWLVEALLREDPRQAAAHLDLLRRQRPDDLTVKFQTARVHRSHGQLEIAGRMLDEILVATPDRVTVLIERARVALDLNRPQDAERWLLHAESLSPGQRELNVALGDCMRQFGRLAESDRYQKKVLDLDAKSEKMQEEWKKKRK